MALIKIAFTTLIISNVCVATFDQEFPDNLYTHEFSIENADVIFEIAVGNHQPEKIRLHKAMLLKSCVLASELDSLENVIPRSFQSSQEATVFKKLIYYLYKDRIEIENFEYLHFLILVNKFGIESVGEIFSSDLKKQIEAQVQDSQMKIPLDSLSQGYLRSHARSRRRDHHRLRHLPRRHARHGGR